MTQINFEVSQMALSLNYTPIEYIGLLQNGPIWIAVLRKIATNRKVLWTYIQAPPAFDINDDSKEFPINQLNCIAIARLIEHVYCIADTITEEILFTERRPMNMLNTIKKFKYNYCDEENVEDEDMMSESSDGFTVDSDGVVHLGDNVCITFRVRSFS